MGSVRSGPEVTNGGDESDPPRDRSAPWGQPPSSDRKPEGGPLTLTTERSTAVQTLNSLERARLCARTAADQKARDILILDMRGITRLYDYFVLTTGASRRQIHTITEEVDAAMRAAGDVRLSVEGYEASTWVVQDYGDVIVHVFDPRAREYYSLEDLWADAPHVPWDRD
jgi:ribosome-associated protein